MKTIDPIETWINTVAYSHSYSKLTRRNYEHHIRKFLDYAETTAEGILEQYNESKTDKQFKQTWTPIITSMIGEMQKQNLAPTSIRTAIAIIKSFFNYHSLPLGYIPTGKPHIRFYNRPITREEIEIIIDDAQPRERAIYALMTQSSLRPNEISKLTIGDIKNLNSEQASYPIIIKQKNTKGKYHGYFTFTGKETIDLIKTYFKATNRENPKEDELVFTMTDNKSPITTDLLTHTFKRTVEKLRKQNMLTFKTEQETISGTTKTKITRNKLRLYNLRKYWFNHNRASTEYKEFWGAHTSKLTSIKHYIDTEPTPENIAKHQEIYEKNALPYLTINTPNKDEKQTAIEQLEKKINKLEQENKQLKKGLDSKLTKQLAQKDEDIEELKAKVAEFSPEKIEKIASTIFQKSWQDLVMKMLGTSADEFKKQIDKEKLKPNVDKVKD